MPPSSDATASTPPPAGSGSVLASVVALAEHDGSAWSDLRIAPSDALGLTAASHVLHYGSACFEGLKAHRQPDGAVRPFRSAKHAVRMAASAEQLMLPAPPEALFNDAIDLMVAEVGPELTPEPPGSLYLRPTLIGNENDVLAAGRPSSTAQFFVVAAGMGNYFADRPLTLLVETDVPRTVTRFGRVKCGANYVMALGLIDQARRDHGADQVLFAPGGIIEETGASNFMVVAGGKVITPPLGEAFLHGVTRDSLLHLAPDLGLAVEERHLTVDELVELAQAPDTEVLLTGTAAVVAPVGTLLHDGERVEVKGSIEAPLGKRLKTALTDIQTGDAPRPADW